MLVISLASNSIAEPFSDFVRINKEFKPASLLDYKIPKEVDIKGDWLDQSWRNVYREDDKLNIDNQPFFLIGYFNEDTKLDYVILLIHKDIPERYVFLVYLSETKTYKPYIIEKDKQSGNYTEMGFYRVGKNVDYAYELEGVEHRGEVDIIKYVYFETAEMTLFYHKESDTFKRGLFSE